MAPDDVRSALVKRGEEVEDVALATLPQSLKYVAIQIKNIIELYKKSDMNTLKNYLENLKEINNLINYFAILSYLIGYNKKSMDIFIRKYSDNFIKYLNNFSANNLRKFINELSEYIIEDSHINNIIKILENLNKENSYEWILRQKRVGRFESDVRSILFHGRGGPGVNRGIKLFVRIFIHKSNIPLAFKIGFNEKEIKKYIIYSDYYTTLVTLRSGAFEDLRTSTSFKLKQKIAKRLLCENRGKKCENIKVRIGSVRGLVRAVAFLSGDPIKYERGAYDIGKNYCSRLKCDECPIRSVCKKYTFIEVK